MTNNYLLLPNASKCFQMPFYVCECWNAERCGGLLSGYHLVGEMCERRFLFAKWYRHSGGLADTRTRIEPCEALVDGGRLVRSSRSAEFTIAPAL